MLGEVKTIRIVGLGLLLLFSSSLFSQENDKLNNELLILYAHEKYDKLQKKSNRLINKKDTSEIIMGYHYSALAHYRMSLDKEYDSFLHFDSTISHVRKYSEMAYGNWSENFYEMRFRISLQLFENIKVFTKRESTDSLLYKLKLNNYEKMIPFSADSLYDAANFLSFKLINKDVISFEVDFRIFEEALHSFHPKIKRNKDDSFRVKYPRYRIDSQLQLALLLKNSNYNVEAIKIMNVLAQWYSLDKEFKEVYDVIVG